MAPRGFSQSGGGCGEGGGNGEWRGWRLMASETLRKPRPWKGQPSGIGVEYTAQIPAPDKPSKRLRHEMRRKPQPLEKLASGGERNGCACASRAVAAARFAPCGKLHLDGPNVAV
eukprot:119607-Chlamydomonas_euryale.AAC.1